jgi:plasmid stabilization system protein ParE
MRRYRVEYSPAVVDQIYAYAKNIAERSQSIEIAQRWSDLVLSSIDRLQYYPKAFALAEENDFVEFEIRKQVVGSYIALYAIDDGRQVVRVIGFRHGRQLPVTAL